MVNGFRPISAWGGGGGGGGLLKRFLYGEAPTRGPTPYTKGTPFIYLQKDYHAYCRKSSLEYPLILE